MPLRPTLLVVGLLLTATACSGSSGERAASPVTSTDVGDTTATGTTGTDTAQRTGDIDFYRSPGARPDRSPGTLVSTEPLPLDGLVGTGLRVTYSSTTPAGDTVHLTGAAILPADLENDGSGSRPVAVWNHPTIGIGTECAPSLAEPFTLDGVQPLLDAGFVVVAPDYDGLGSEGVHPYLVLESQGRSVLDMARVAAELGGNRTVVTWGHSQGGHAALSARAIAERYAPELEVAGVGAASPPTDLGLFLDPGFSSRALLPITAQTAVSWATVYTNTGLEALGSPEALALAGAALDACVGDIAAVVGDMEPSEVWARGPEQVPAWGVLTARNSIDPSSGTGPVYLTHGGADTLVPKQGSDALVDGLCAEGTDVVYRSAPDWNHGTAYEVPRPDMIEWLIAVARGERPGSTC